MCTSPTTAWLPNTPDSEGKQTLLFRPPPSSKAIQFKMIETPCGKCIACESLRSLRTAMQLSCELHTTKSEAFFLTLTYSDEKLESDFSVHKKTIKNFIRRLRDWQLKNNQPNCRYLNRGEYGGETARPHYHSILFGIEIPDMEQQDSSSQPAYTSKIIEDLWGFGTVHIKRLTFENILYFAKHHFEEKVELKDVIHKIPIIHPTTRRRILERLSEFTTRSCKPGIGHDFFHQYQSEIYVTDSLVHQGQEMPVPIYFDKLLKKAEPERYELIKQQRAESIEYKTSAENRYQEKFNKAKLKSKKR